jgi:hypothetical protein
MQNQATAAGARWQFWIDRGGTFTDVVAKRPDGVLVTHKLLSDNPEQYKDAAVAGIRHLLGLQAGEPVTPQMVECVKMGTTVATNALLERKGEPTLLVTTKGFRDALRIAYQNRPRLFDRPSCSTARSLKRGSGSAPRARSLFRWTKRSCGKNCRRPMRAACEAWPSYSCTATATHNTSRRPGAWRKRPASPRSAPRTKPAR